MSQDTKDDSRDMVARTAIVVAEMLRHFHYAVRDVEDNDITIGIILGTAMFCDDRIGPFRTEELMALAPDIVLKNDAYVTPKNREMAMQILRTFGKHLVDLP